MTTEVTLCATLNSPAWNSQLFPILMNTPSETSGGMSSARRASVMFAGEKVSGS